MKRVLMLMLIVCILLVSGCAKDYTTIFEEMKTIELEEVFGSEEEKLAFITSVQDNYNSKKYLTIKKSVRTYDYFYDEYADETTYLESEIVLKYEVAENELSLKVKSEVEKGIPAIKTMEEDYIKYFENEVTYCNDYVLNKKYSYGGNGNNIESIVISTSYKNIDNTYFINMFHQGEIDKIGLDSKGNIVIINSWTNEKGQEGFEKYIFKNENFVSYELIVFEKGNFQNYVMETYSYKKNNVRYPDFKKYEYAGNFYN